MKLHSAALFFFLFAAAPLMAADEPAPVKIGIIGLDTSHVPAFTKLFNNPKADGDLAGFRVVAGYPGGTDYPPSRDRVKKFTDGMRDAGVEIVDTIPELLAKVDVVLLESVDGRIHLQEAIPVILAKKPVFIDKPVAGSLVDAMAIYELARRHNVPCFSSSSYRFSPGVVGLKNSEQVGEVLGAETWGPCSYQAGTPDLCFYGIHGVESLFTLMGGGCESVTRLKTKDVDLVAGVWSGGRIGSFRGIRGGKSTAGAVVFGKNGIVSSMDGASYEHLCREIGKFFRTRQAPVSPEETIEMFAFMEAADESVRRDGQPVRIAEILKQAADQVETRLQEISSSTKGAAGQGS
ncbi:hypothetical protein Pan44_06330 [Caulifigura coniformis]|uniref:Gfo/Idh/MocA-like oxidoreductase N-terminal domain-containing protein n=1 Tax=Caulifigura coniformis TaxID=2527983 RepID=A0A517S916_9PLAN|nr:Gfo/Idh/MocA family oxidoreductase [Caulifigura coniformis]QDT52621.1 hypothetical protein Pan44_06330 [Caulifigura coniformis]